MSGKRLSAEEVSVVEFAARAPRQVGAREEAIVQELGISPVRYYQLLNRLVDNPAAWELDPHVMGRIARLREG